MIQNSGWFEINFTFITFILNTCSRGQPLVDSHPVNTVLVERNVIVWVKVTVVAPPVDTAHGMRRQHKNQLVGQCRRRISNPVRVTGIFGVVRGVNLRDPATLRIRSLAVSCTVKLEMPRSW